MKNVSIFALVMIGLASALSSCHDAPTIQPSQITATYGGAQHTFQADNGMFIYQSANYSVVQAAEAATHDSISIAVIGSNVGTYPIGQAYTNSISLTHDGHHYSSQNSRAHGHIDITRLDAATMMATGTFTGTLMRSPGTTADSLPVTLGVISVRYQF